MIEEINNCIKILKRGGVILYPTDTIWGIGCDAKNKNSIKRIYDIKNRNESKALITLVSDNIMLKEITGFIPNIPLDKKPTTIIYQNITTLPRNLISTDSSAAIRVVKDEFCQNLIRLFGDPIVSTSANISVENSPKIFSDISKKIIENVDYIVDLRKEEKMEIPSKIIKIEKNKSLTIIRS